MKIFKRNRIVESFISIGLLVPLMSNVALADANVACGNGATITNITVFGGSYTASNNCGNNVTITTSGSKNIGGGNETANTNGIYFSMNGPHPAFTFGDSLTVTTSGSFVDAIRTNGTSSVNGVYTVIAGDNATLTATGSNSNGINVAQSLIPGRVTGGFILVSPAILLLETVLQFGLTYRLRLLSITWPILVTMPIFRPAAQGLTAQIRWVTRYMPVTGIAY
ncbi:hypothetical protein [Budvicia aquatica]|uniref:Uncharacterized protein n=1 Tax=Budvicia aquatica TaxID=82979 RepID=A0A484ZJQ3_9GAMM|nr:hypothetical protein [Budvicia aquatica]VFS48712.1 Uncharacterised protein [Budvicia aquatica]